MAPTTAPNATLRDAIFRSGQPQIEVARKAGIHETRLSKIVRGWVQPNAAERRSLARVLKSSVEELFGQSSAVAS